MQHFCDSEVLFYFFNSTNKLAFLKSQFLAHSLLYLCMGADIKTKL